MLSFMTNISKAEFSHFVRKTTAVLQVLRAQTVGTLTCQSLPIPTTLFLDLSLHSVTPLQPAALHVLALC